MVYMELCPALQGGEKVPHTETGLWEIILCNYLVTVNILSDWCMKPAYLLTLTCTKGRSLWSMVINTWKSAGCVAFDLIWFFFLNTFNLNAKPPLWILTSLELASKAYRPIPSNTLVSIMKVSSNSFISQIHWKFDPWCITQFFCNFILFKIIL